MYERGGECGGPGGEVLHPGIQAAYEIVDRNTIHNQATNLAATYSEVVPVDSDEYGRNARTAMWEGLRAWGHVSRIEITGTLAEIQAQVVNRLVRGLQRDLPQHEYDRRFTELCNVLVINEVERAVVSGLLPADTVIHEQSDYPCLLRSKVADELGYRSRNEKGFSRSTHLVDNGDGTYTRVTESLSRSNASDGSTHRFFEGAGVQLVDAVSPDLQALATPVLYAMEQYPDGVVDIQRLLDGHASELAGESVRYGERVSQRSGITPYSEVREESRHNEEMAAFYEEDLARLEERLDQLVASRQITFEEKTNQYHLELLQILRAICAFKPQFAEDCFGEEAAVRYTAASNLLAQGRNAEAMLMLQTARAVEQPVIICGGMIEAQRAAELGVSVSDLSTLIQKGRENWKKIKGACRIKYCPSPKPTELGPCQVCLCNCQPIFDKGREPSYAPPAQRMAEAVVALFRGGRTPAAEAA